MERWITMQREPYGNEEMNIREFAALNGFDEWAVHAPNSSLRKTLYTGKQKVTGSYYEALPGAEFARLLRNSKTGDVCYIAQPQGEGNCKQLLRWAEKKTLMAKSVKRANGRYLVAITYALSVQMPGGEADEKRED